MASKTFFQVSTIPSARAGVVHAHHSFPSNGKLNFCSRALKSSESLSLSSPSSSLFTSLSNAVDYPRNRGAFMVCKARETVNEVLVVTDSSWDNLVISSETPVLVEFWAPWCGPCRMIAPVIDELAKQYAGKIACFKLNTDDCPTIATQYGIRSIPTVLFFKNGEKKESVIGAVPKSTLTTTIEKYVEI